MTSRPTCEPRYATERDPNRPTFGLAIAQVARQLGQPLMPWQEQVAMVGGELDDNGWPAYREVVFTVPRQSGKTTVILSWQIQRAVGWGSPQRIVYSAQTGNDARRKLIEDQVPLLNLHKRKLGIDRILKGMGNEAIEFVNGSRIGLLASSEESGHGKTVDLSIKDELFADIDDRRDQALVPAMATKAAAQIVTASTMGTDESTALNAAVERGRRAVTEGHSSGIAYFEWAATPYDDPDDPATWWRCMPALGHTISENVVRHARATLKDGEFKRAFMNIRYGRKADPVFEVARWLACKVPGSKLTGRIVLSYDVSPDRQWSSIAAAGASDSSDATHLEVVENGHGTSWVMPRLRELKAKHHPLMIVCDGASPAAALLSEAEVLGLDIRQVSTREHIDACGAIYDAVHERAIVHLGQASLDDAVDGADRREVTDAWLWSRKNSSVNITPLVAITLARWGYHLRKRNLWVA